MIDYVALNGDAADPRAADRAKHIIRSMPKFDTHWRILLDSPGLFVAEDCSRPGRRMSAILAGGRGALIGRLFDRSATEVGEVQPASIDWPSGQSAEEFCRKLTTNCWGAYVAILREPGAREAAVFRDPIGALDCLSWESGGVRIIASRLFDCLIDRATPLELDWRRIARFLVDAPAAAGSLAFGNRG